MRHTFVLDENIVVAITTLENEKGERDLTSANLFTEIIESCHCLGWSRAIYARWCRQIDNLISQRKAIGPSFLALLAQVQRVPDKCFIPDEGDPPALADEHLWSTKMQDDIDFIRLAAYFGFGCLLTTVDDPLIDDLTRLDLDTRYSFSAVRPAEATEFAKQPCD